MTRSDTVLTIAKQLDGIWSLDYYLKIIPKPIRDWFYDLVARHRHKFLRKYDK